MPKRDDHLKSKEDSRQATPSPAAKSVDTLPTVRAIKCVKQSYTFSAEVLELMEQFRLMVNDAIRIGLENDVSTLRRLCSLSYKQLSKYTCPSYYKPPAISKAAGILSARKKSIKRGYPTKSPYVKGPILSSYYGFRIENGKLKIPLGDKTFEHI